MAQNDRASGWGLHVARFVAVALALGLFVPVDALGAEHRQKQVLVLYSVRRDAQIAILGNHDLPQILEAGLGESIDYYSEYLEIDRFRVPQYEQAFRDFLRLKYRDKRLDVILATSAAVTDFIARNRREFFPDTPVVFFEARSSTRQPMANSTGVISEIKLGGTLDLAMALQPDLRHVFVVSTVDDNVDATESLARRQFRPFESRLTVTYLSDLARDDLEARLSALPDHSMVFYFTLNRDASGEFFHPLAYVDRLSRLANAPVYSWVDSTIGHGVIGGVMKDQRAELREIARIALRILHEESAASIPVNRADVNIAQVDWRELPRWHIDEARVPATTVIRFREPGIWGRYRGYLLGIIVVVIGQSVLIGLLLVQRVRRRQAEALAVGAEAKLHTSYDRIRDLGGRLLMAQEAERSRIARELHDDVGQQMALLAIGLERVRATVSSVSPQAHALAEQTIERARGMSKTLHDLSHRLHPILLRHVGLTVALQRMVDELSHDKCDIVFHYSRVPESLPHDVTLCVFRIAQEALQNVVRHSAAHHASIDLIGSATELILRVEDNGVGFDLEAARNEGLGLLSMAERLEALHGLLNISTRPGAGTCLTIVVPLGSRKVLPPRQPNSPTTPRRPMAHSGQGHHDIL